LQELSARRPLILDERGRELVHLSADGEVLARFRPPQVQAVPEDLTTRFRPRSPPSRGRVPVAEEVVAAYLEGLEAVSLGLELVLLFQAGAAALGLWRDDILVAHKVLKRYVVRGKGRAQPVYLKTKGKSRYGSRLRLQNFRLLLSETNEKLHAWWREHGPPDRLYVSCPVRLLPELFAADPPPPFDRRARLERIPLDVRVPSFEELKRVRFALTRGWVWEAGES
jgi:hypothetical protein